MLKKEVEKIFITTKRDLSNFCNNNKLIKIGHYFSDKIFFTSVFSCRFCICFFNILKVLFLLFFFLTRAKPNTKFIENLQHTIF